MQSSQTSPAATLGPNADASVDYAETPPKRKRDVGRMSYPRKRALRACEACRKRKIKCDNQRPTCGGCKDLEIECQFGDGKNDRSTYDLASLEILERLDYAVGLLEATRDTSITLPIHHASPAADVNAPHAAANQHPTPASIPWSDDNAKGDAETLLESLEIAGRNAQVSEDILDWPIFQGRYDRSRTETLIFNPRPRNINGEPMPTISEDAVRTVRSGRGIREEDVPQLINTFLVNVHIKNPILDSDDIKAKGRLIVEHGFSWNAASCLVLIVCALASISSTFHPSQVTPALVGGAEPLNSVSDSPEYSTAESYYVAAEKRIGLLENAIITTQCYFLSGVYEMYSLRPLKAWTSFTRACVSLQIYLRGQPQRNFSSSKGLERRLYWSCLKSECEVRMELTLPPTGLAKVNYPDVFPSPPTTSPNPMSTFSRAPTSNAHRSSFSAQRLEPDEEVIWWYYTSEIAVRKIGNRVMNCLYEHDETSWITMPPNKMIRIAEELELQLTQWFTNLPAVLAAPTPKHGDEVPPDRLVATELKFMLHARLYDFRERIYRPFLWLCLYHPPTEPIQESLAPYVQRHVQACINALLRGTPRHRHHGTWFENRGMFMKSLLLIAAVKSGKVQVANIWRECVELCIVGFKFWEQEAPDLKEARYMLESLLAELHCP